MDYVERLEIITALWIENHDRNQLQTELLSLYNAISHKINVLIAKAIAEMCFNKDCQNTMIEIAKTKCSVQDIDLEPLMKDPLLKWHELRLCLIRHLVLATGNYTDLSSKLNLTTSDACHVAEQIMIQLHLENSYNELYRTAITEILKKIPERQKISMIHKITRYTGDILEATPKNEAIETIRYMFCLLEPNPELLRALARRSRAWEITHIFPTKCSLSILYRYAWIAFREKMPTIFFELYDHPEFELVKFHDTR